MIKFVAGGKFAVVLAPILVIAACQPIALPAGPTTSPAETTAPATDTTAATPEGQACARDLDCSGDLVCEDGKCTAG